MKDLMLNENELIEVTGGGAWLGAIGAVTCGVGGFLTGGVAGAWGGAATGAGTCGIAGAAVK